MISLRRHASSTLFASTLVLASTAALFLSGCAEPQSHNFAVYGINAANNFGKLDLTKGKLTTVGAALPEPVTGLALGSNGTLITLAFSGNLYSVDPTTAKATKIGATGLADCTLPTSPCGPTSAFTVGVFGSQVYANDFANNLYTLNLTTGKATLLGATGIPGAPYIAGSTNKDGSFNFIESNLFSANGKFYETYSASVVDFAKGTLNAVIPGALYQIDTTTGKATRIAAVANGLTTAVNVDGVVYAYNSLTNQWETLSLTDGKLTLVSTDPDPTLGPIFAAYAIQIP